MLDKVVLTLLGTVHAVAIQWPMDVVAQTLVKTLLMVVAAVAAAATVQQVVVAAETAIHHLEQYLVLLVQQVELLVQLHLIA